VSHLRAGALSLQGPLTKTREFLEMIKFEHTIFALPFAYLTLFVVAQGWPSPSLFLWITLAMVAGRTFGMAVNRLIDSKIDARNPRTAKRSLPAGRMSAVEVVVFMAIALVLFLVAVYHLSPLAQKLWPIVIAVMSFYPYTKRFTWLSHLALGLVYVMVPAGVWIAVRNDLPIEALLLGIGAGLWVAGFDIIYACQDATVDREQGLHSMPADLGLGRALWIARIFHGAFFAALIAVGTMIEAGSLYYMGVLLSGGLLLYEHRMVSPGDLSRVNAAFFTINGVMSIALFVLAAADIVIGS
jgi:4-hydroxybenzoate polyprenyltransferase